MSDSTDLVFPDGFLWGAATAAHQVEGGNEHSDWWQWERAPGTPCVEPSGSACEHFTRYPQDVALMADLGLTTYRFSVEWARIEPSPGVIDEAALRHYRDVVDCVVASGLVPFVTLNHFTLPAWVGQDGGWTAPSTPALFAGYCRRAVDALGPDVGWYSPINEAGTVATGGYLGQWGFPPNVSDLDLFRRAVDGLVEGHLRAVDAVRAQAPWAKVGSALFTSENVVRRGGAVAADLSQELSEEPFLAAAAGDDFIGVQTYSRFTFDASEAEAAEVKEALRTQPLESVLPRILAMADMADGTLAPAGARLTDMGWEFAPEAAAETVRRIAARYPDKDLVVTEHGVATADDAERVEFLTRGLAALHATIEDGVRLRGYLHWSLMDNFEWASGYGMRFGLIGVDRTTQERTVRPSARLLGQVARTGRLTP